jgi:hypothetical protein
VKTYDFYPVNLCGLPWLVGLVKKPEKRNTIMKTLLQSLFDQANWYGYAKHKNRTYYPSRIEAIARKAKVEITYSCPA